MCRVFFTPHRFHASQNSKLYCRSALLSVNVENIWNLTNFVFGLFLCDIFLYGFSAVNLDKPVIKINPFLVRKYTIIRLFPCREKFLSYFVRISETTQLRSHRSICKDKRFWINQREGFEAEIFLYRLWPYTPLSGDARFCFVASLYMTFLWNIFWSQRIEVAAPVAQIKNCSSVRQLWNVSLIAIFLFCICHTRTQ